MVPFRDDLRNLLPHAVDVTFEGNHLLVVKHGFEETKLLNNLGIEVPAPVLHHYDWCGAEAGPKPPFTSQRKTVAMLTTNRRAYVLNGMGTGKTKCPIWAFDYLRRQGEAKKMLVVAPLSILDFVWAREIMETAPHLRIAVLHGTRQRRLDRLGSDADIYIINHDGVGTIIDELHQRRDIDVLLLDELAVYRSASASRAKKMMKFARHFKWAWGMTGGPTPNSPTDAWAQAKILTPLTVPDYFKRFQEQTTYQASAYIRLPKKEATEIVANALQPAVRFTLDDVTELPECVERQVDILQGPVQEKAYRSLKSAAYAMLKDGQVTAVNAAVVLNKLLQVSMGYVYRDDAGTSILDNDARLEKLLECVEQTERKLIVFVPYIHAINGVSEYLRKHHVTCGVINGEVAKGQRDRIFKLFQHTGKLKTLVAHPRTMSHGLTLTSADTVVWFGPTASLETFDQANARIRRVGQLHRQQILMFQGTQAEKAIYTRLSQKQEVQNSVLELLQEATK